MDYNLHRHVFARAANFPPMWGPQDPFQEPHYLSETKVDFDRLLSVLYPADYSEHECQTTEEWTSVLMLAERWKIQDVRRLAIKQLDLCAGPVDKIALGHRYSIPDWLGPAYLALITRREPFTREEGAKLGVEAMVRVGTLTDDLCDNFQDYVDEKKFSELFARKLAM
ncbi:hypothetical protein B0H11DRAFT_1712056 [Mycena galericulata]|nr:hypothetical protein B0H11DRAFT_1712056 [Mycena galericulata]